jgi:hypothetical protein
MKEKYSLREASVRCGWEEDEVSRLIEEEYLFEDEKGFLSCLEFDVLRLATAYCEVGFPLHEALRMARQDMRMMLFVSDCA